MHDYMFIIYGSNVSVLYFVKVYTFLILKVLIEFFSLLLINVITKKKKKKSQKWNENTHIDRS